jgi:hypothetical protein
MFVELTTELMNDPFCLKSKIVESFNTVNLHLFNRYDPQQIYEAQHREEKDLQN